MTDTELQAIRERAKKAEFRSFEGSAIVGTVLPRMEDVIASARDVPVLLAEVERLQATCTNAAAILRCKHTYNLCGTDTRPLGHPCRCQSCRTHAELTLALGATRHNGGAA